MDNDISIIISQKDEDISNAVKNFVKKADQTFTFPELNQGNRRKELWEALLHFATKVTDNAALTDCFSAVRILSRDKTNLNELVNDGWLNLIQKYSGLKTEDETINYQQDVAIEALKCLCNIIFNSPIALTVCVKSGTLEGIINRLKTYKNPKLLPEVKFFDMKLLFLITALYPEMRKKLKEEYHGIKYLSETVSLILDQATGQNGHNLENVTGLLEDIHVDILCEILKVLFYITVRKGDQDNIDEEEEAQYLDLVTVLRNLLIAPAKTSEKKLELVHHTVNLLTNMPKKCYDPLLIPVTKDESLSYELQFEDFNMTAIHEILIFLENKFAKEPSVTKQHELLSPVLTVLLKCVACNRIMRKYLRQRILPPLKDVHNRPEEGTTLRNYLCRLLTSPITQVKDLAAELLFALCKHNVNRMIKYTGYGNAAGLFASRGLLGGRQSEGAALYSSDSSDSDTEEYREHKHGINPVMGCYQPPHPDPTANMTEEQKEYEVMKLVELMDSMTRKGIVKPCKIGEDGKPEPVEHVLQLQEGLPSQQIRRENENDDDDDM